MYIEGHTSTVSVSVTSEQIIVLNTRYINDFRVKPGLSNSYHVKERASRQKESNHLNVTRNRVSIEMTDPKTTASEN